MQKRQEVAKGLRIVSSGSGGRRRNRSGVGGGSGGKLARGDHGALIIGMTPQGAQAPANPPWRPVRARAAACHPTISAESQGFGGVKRNPEGRSIK